MSNGVGLDIGTNMLVAGTLKEDGTSEFRMQRDAFYRLVPKSAVNRNSIKRAMDQRGFNYIEDADGSFIVVGEEALETAIERNDVAKRPLRRGVISPKEKSSLPMLKVLIENLLGKGDGNKLIYSVPARPIDGNFDIIFHQEMMGKYLSELGYIAQPINEAFAIAFSELLDEGLTGICLSFGAGMVNTAVVHQGDPLVEFSMTRAGDYIDLAAGTALDISPSLVQLEKESGVDLTNPTATKINEAVSVYYGSVIKYALDNIAWELNHIEKELPIFREAVDMVVSGGLTKAVGFTDKINKALKGVKFPIQIKEVRLAGDPMTAVANGCLLAAQI